MTPPPVRHNPTGPQIRTALHDRAIANICNHQSQTMEIDSGGTGMWDYDPNQYPEAINDRPSRLAEVTYTDTQPVEYLPSRPQSGAAQRTMT